MKNRLSPWCLVALPFAIFLVLVVLKLTCVISMSWWWITAPLWLPNALLVVVCLAAMAYLWWWQWKHPDEAKRMSDLDDYDEY